MKLQELKFNKKFNFDTGNIKCAYYIRLDRRLYFVGNTHKLYRENKLGLSNVKLWENNVFVGSQM